MDEELVEKLLEKGQELTLKQVVDSVHYCGMNCNMMGNNPRWDQYFNPLREAIDEAYPGEVFWDEDGIYFLKREDRAGEVVSRDIKEKYIRILLFSKGKR